MHIKTINTKQEISCLLQKHNDDFVPSLLERVKDFDAYAEKLNTNAVNITAVGPDGRIMGFISFYSNDKTGKIAYCTILVTEKESRKAGVGCFLLKAFEEVSKNNGMEYLKLSTNIYNKPAICLYMKNGYEISEFIDDDKIYMRKKIN